jgi:hypothetical protein
MLEHEADARRVESGVEGVEHRARHRYAEVRFIHLRRVRQQRGDGVTCRHSPGLERRGQPPSARVGLCPGESAALVHDREAIRQTRALHLRKLSGVSGA